MAKKKQRKQKKRLQWLAGWSRRKKMITATIVAVILVFLAASTAAYVFINKKNDTNTEAAGTSDEKRWRDYREQSARDSAVLDEAKQALDTGDVRKAEDIYDSAVKDEEDVARKVRLMVDKSKLLHAADKYDEAIAVAKEAEALGEDKYLAAAWLAKVYEGAKDYKQAAHYYTLTGQWAHSQFNYANFSKSYYDRHAARMQLLLEGQ